MSCNSYRANYFRLFFYAAAFSMAHEMKHTLFKDNGQLYQARHAQRRVYCGEKDIHTDKLLAPPQAS